MKEEIIEKELLAGTDESANQPSVSGESKKELPAKSRSMSGTSMTSDISSGDEEFGIYTSMDGGRRVRYVRTLRLPSDQLKALQLEYGSNEARFSITTKFQVTLSNIPSSIHLF